MKNIWILPIIPLFLLAFCGQGYANLENEEPSVSEDGYWELKSVDVHVFPNNENEQRTLSRGRGTFQLSDKFVKYQSSYSWTEPEDRYKEGQSVDLTISVKIVPGGYVWTTGGPKGWDENIIAAFETGDYLRDPQGIADARILTIQNGIVIQSESRRVSGKFPLGSRGGKLLLYVYCQCAGWVYYIYEWVEPARVMEGSYWERTSVEIQKVKDTRNSQNILEGGKGVYKTFDDNETFQVTYSFAEPGASYYPGQSVDLTLSAYIDRYTWNGQFNNMGGRIDAGFLPGRAFKSPEGSWTAGVSAVNGKIVVGRASITVSGKFPPGQKNGKETLYINCDKVGRILYHYRWVDVD